MRIALFPARIMYILCHVYSQPADGFDIINAKPIGMDLIYDQNESGNIAVPTMISILIKFIRFMGITCDMKSV